MKSIKKTNWEHVCLFYKLGGKMAESWYELLKNLWQGNSNYLNPSDFRSIFVKFAHQVKNKC